MYTILKYRLHVYIRYILLKDLLYIYVYIQNSIQSSLIKTVSTTASKESVGPDTAIEITLLIPQPKMVSLLKCTKKYSKRSLINIRSDNF